MSFFKKGFRFIAITDFCPKLVFLAKTRPKGNFNHPAAVCRRISVVVLFRNINFRTHLKQLRTDFEQNFEQFEKHFGHLAETYTKRKFGSRNDEEVNGSGKSNSFTVPLLFYKHINS